MNSSTLNIINKKLENEPQEILDRVLAYLEDILEDKNSKKTDFELTEEQKNSIHKIKNSRKAIFCGLDVQQKFLIRGNINNCPR